MRINCLGRRIVDLQTSLAILNSHSSTGEPPLPPDEFERDPFSHPALETLPRLTEDVRKDAMARKRLAGIAERYGLLTVLRWKPKKVGTLLAAEFSVFIVSS